MEKKKPIYTIGHRNPDTDSICSAIGYAYLKQQLGCDAVAARAGKINPETKYALEYFQVDEPQLLTDVYPRVKDVMLECSYAVQENASIRRLGEIMRKHSVKSVPVNNEEGKLVGIVTVSDLAKRYLQELSMQNFAEAGASFRDIIGTIDGEVIVSGDEGAKVAGNVRIAAGSVQQLKDLVKHGDVVLVGDRRDETMLDCIGLGVSCLIVTGNGRLPADIIEAAQKKNLLVICSPHDTYTCARLINQCVPVKRIMQTDLVCFQPEALLSDIKGKMAECQFSAYPVVENDKLIGIVSRDNLIEPEKEQLILVDHNERGQAVEGLDNARILEIIDHHRLGGLQTADPIFTRQEPVGCTATIVANMFWNRNIEIPKKIAGMLLSAVLSDTVLYKSPTCTAKDKETAEKLAAIAGVKIEEYGMEMLKAGSSVGDMKPADIAKNDSKEFKMGDLSLLIGQIQVMDTEEVLAKKAEIVTSMKALCEEKHYDMCLLMVTDILKESTELLFAGSPRNLIGEAFKKETGEDSVYLPGVMSRKKQIVPPLMDAVKHLAQ